MTTENREKLLAGADPKLDSFRNEERAARFRELCEAVKNGSLAADAFSDRHNMHCHTFYSYNCLQWSPSHVALAGRLLGLSRLGKVDFDVLNGLDEFRNACRALGIRSVCGMETRVYIPEMKDVEINSPGEKGIAYHMGLGFVSEKLTGKAASFARDLAERAGKRTRLVVERVNKALGKLTLDFDRDVIPLTPAGNPTERHVCSAYRKKAIAQFGEEGAMKFWQDVLGLSPEAAAKAAGSVAALEGSIRSKLMKSGGPGYIRPDASSFPTLDEMNAFSLECGAVPCAAWLNGFSGGEADPERLLSFHMAKGMRVLAIIPDRNWNIADPAKKEASIRNLFAVAEAAKKLGLPITAGTELNSPGNKLVDGFEEEPLRTLFDQFLQGADFACSLEK